MNYYDNWKFNYCLKINQRVDLFYRERNSELHPLSIHKLSAVKRDKQLKKAAKTKPIVNTSNGVDMGVPCYRPLLAIRKGRIRVLFHSHLRIFFGKKCRPCKKHNL